MQRLTVHQLAALHVLWRLGPCTQQQIADAIGLNGVTGSVINALMRRNMITVYRYDDRYVLTKKGKRYAPTGTM